MVLSFRVARKQNPMYAIVLNIALCETMFAIGMSILFMYIARHGPVSDKNKKQQFRKSFIIVYLMAVTTFHASIFSTTILTLDRYITIRYCLRYHSMISVRRSYIVMVFTWILSIVLTFAEISLRKRFSFNRAHLITDVVLAVCCIITVTIGAYTLKIRQKHVKSITSQDLYFGVQAQRLTILRRLKQTIIDTLRINFFAVFIVILHIIIHSVYDKRNRNSLLVLFIYSTLNPPIFAATLTELRKSWKLIMPLPKLGQRSNRVAAAGDSTSGTD